MAHQSPVGLVNLRQLDTSNGCQDHTALPYAATSFVCVSCSAHGKPALRARFPPPRPRPPHPIPTLVTMANAPLRNGMAQACRDDLPDKHSGIFFERGLDRNLLICPSGNPKTLSQRRLASHAWVIRKLDQPRIDHAHRPNSGYL